MAGLTGGGIPASGHAPETGSRRPLPRRIGSGILVVLAMGAVAYGPYHRSDAYRHGNRLFYADGGPNRAGRAVGRFWVALADAGLGPSYLVALETIGRRSGRSGAVPLVLADWAGARYAVSMLGERSPWVHNVRAAEGRAVLRHGGRREVRLTEVPPAERAPILKAYLARAVGGRPHIPVDPGAPLAAFGRVAADYPVFRIADERPSPGPQTS